MLNEERLTQNELTSRERIIHGMKKNKKNLLNKFGKDAERVMYGRATNIAKKKSLEEKQLLSQHDERILQIIKSVLSKYPNNIK